MAILFISNIVPDTKPYNGCGFTRSGNNVLLGIAKSLPKDATTKLVSCRPIASFPQGPLWIKGEKVKIGNQQEITILPTLNIKGVKNIVWGICINRVLKKWSFQHANDRRDVLVYNIYTPPISWVYKSCKKTKSKLTAILYDLGVPPARLKLSWLSMQGYKSMEKEAEKYIPLLDGRVVINESIIKHYAPNRDYILVDGGINDVVISRLFQLKENKSNSFVLVLAGMLWDQNGTKLVLDSLGAHPELNVKVFFAGKGIDVPVIQSFSEKDSRVEYVGMLDQDELFKLYERADILLNLRIEEEVDFHFPSKLLEYLVTGKHVLSTPIAHAERDYGRYLTILHDITPDGLAKCILNIMNEGKRSLFEKGQQARQFMLDKRNWKTRTKEIIDYMNSL